MDDSLFFKARSGHSTTLLDGETSVVIGGYDGEQRFDDAWLYDSENFLKPLKVVGNEFVGRAGHVSCRLSNDSLVLGLGYASDRHVLGDFLVGTVRDEVLSFETIIESRSVFWMIHCYNDV